MPPKRSRGSTAKAKESSKTFTSIGIQTEDDYNNDIVNYQKQIELLQQKIADYTTQVIALQSENNHLRNQSKNTDSDAVKIVLMGRNALKISNEKVSSPRSGTKTVKGCSCKGTCSNKICGCVKKGIPCQEFCRCNDAQCKNQEPDKENVVQAVLSQDGQKVLEKLGRLTLNQETLHASEKKAKRGMFSPFGDRTGIGNADKLYPASPLTFETRRRLFTQDSDDIVDIGSNTDEGDSLATEPEYIDPEENIMKIEKSQAQLPHTPVAKRTRRLKNTEKDVEIAINNKTEQWDDPKIPKQVKVKQNIQLDQKLQQETNDENVEQSQLPAILITNSNEQSDNEDVLLPETLEQVARSPRVLRNKSKSVSPDQYVVRRKYGHDKATEKIKSRSVSPQDKTSQPKLGRVQHSPQPSSSQIIPTVNEQNIHSKEDNETTNLSQGGQIQLKNQLSPHSNINKNSLSFESNASENSSSSNNDILDISLNPMVPKHQLPRSPINAAGSIIIPAEKKRFSPPKKELAVVEVNWEQHQSELVMCTICKRKFFPHRIEKHVTSCKGI